MRSILEAKPIAVLAGSLVVLALVGCGAGQAFEPPEAESVAVETTEGVISSELQGVIPEGTTLEANDNVNLRSAASMGATVLDVVRRGSHVETLGTAPAVNGFVRVTAGDLNGYTAVRYYRKLALPAKPKTPLTLTQADAHFVSQWGPTPSNTGGTLYGFNDCGPTSAVMALGVQELLGHPTPRDAMTAIDHLRDLMYGYNTSQSQRMTLNRVMIGLRSMGAVTSRITPTLGAVKAALQAGHSVIAGGEPWAAWGQAQYNAGNYLNSHDPGNHFVALLGMTNANTFIVADPLFRYGTRAVSGPQLVTFLSGTWADAIKLAAP